MKPRSPTYPNTPVIVSTSINNCITSASVIHLLTLEGAMSRCRSMWLFYTKKKLVHMKLFFSWDKIRFRFRLDIFNRLKLLLMLLWFVSYLFLDLSCKLCTQCITPLCVCEVYNFRKLFLSRKCCLASLFAKKCTAKNELRTSGNNVLSRQLWLVTCFFLASLSLLRKCLCSPGFMKLDKVIFFILYAIGLLLHNRKKEKIELAVANCFPNPI